MFNIRETPLIDGRTAPFNIRVYNMFPSALLYARCCDKIIDVISKRTFHPTYRDYVVKASRADALKKYVNRLPSTRRQIETHYISTCRTRLPGIVSAAHQ